MNKTTFIVISALIFSCFVFNIGIAEGASLTLLEKQTQYFKNGEPVAGPFEEKGTYAKTEGIEESLIPPQGGVGTATGAGAAADETNPAFSAATAAASVLFMIEPDGGEAYGDCVLVTYQFFGLASATADANGDALAGFGGDSVGVNSSPLEIIFSLPARVVVNPNGSAQEKFVFDGATVADGEPQLNIVRSGKFFAQIGDEIELAAGSGSAAAAYAPFGEAFAESVGIIMANLEPCPINCVNNYSGKLSLWGPMHGFYSNTGNGYAMELSDPAWMCEERFPSDRSGFGLLTGFFFGNGVENSLQPLSLLGHDGSEWVLTGEECWRGDMSFGCAGSAFQKFGPDSDDPDPDGRYECYIWGTLTDLLFGRIKLRGEALCAKPAVTVTVTVGNPLLPGFSPGGTLSLDYKGVFRPENICGNNIVEEPYEDCEPPGGSCEDCQLPKGACCLDGALDDGCSIDTVTGCASAGGIYMGDNTGCNTCGGS